uniref:Ribosomal protein S19 n=1 Tax=Gefionella okellyi TaxID=2853422 RepID=A0A0B5H2V1_9EUKA|nr:ribosomal protein S19 [Gefionella okellyi]
MINTQYSLIKQLYYNKPYYKFKTNNLFILPLFKHKQIQVYNGLKYIKLNLKLNMSGFNLRHFIYYKKSPIFKKKR